LRQAWRVTALRYFDRFKQEFDDLMAGQGFAWHYERRRAGVSFYILTAPRKIEAGHYNFAVDERSSEKAKPADTRARAASTSIDLQPTTVERGQG
jgi:hypothetical protein